MRSFILLLCLSFAALADDAPRPHITHAVLVHGIWESGKNTFPNLQRDLESRGVECLVPSLKPATAHQGITPLAEQLKREIDEAFGEEQTFLLVGHSMGGLVSRVYLQELGGAKRCQFFVTTASPHHGTRMAKLHPGQGSAEMRIGSDFLKRLAKGEAKLGNLPIISYRTPLDAIIVPSESSIWDRAENISIRIPMHNLVSDSPRVRADLLPRFDYPHAPVRIKRDKLVKGPPHRRL